MSEHTSKHKQSAHPLLVIRFSEIFTLRLLVFFDSAPWDMDDDASAISGNDASQFNVSTSFNATSTSMRIDPRFTSKYKRNLPWLVRYRLSLTDYL